MTSLQSNLLYKSHKIYKDTGEEMFEDNNYMIFRNGMDMCLEKMMERFNKTRACNSKIIAVLDDELPNVCSVLRLGDWILEEHILIGFQEPKALFDFISFEDNSKYFDDMFFVLDYNLNADIHGVGVLEILANKIPINDSNNCFPALMWTGNGPEIRRSERLSAIVNRFSVEVLDKLDGLDVMANKIQAKLIRKEFPKAS